MTAPGRLVGIGRTAEVFEFGPGRVVKLLRPGFPAEAAAAEARVAELVAAAYPSAPACDGVVTVDDRPGIVYERVDGPSMEAFVRRRLWEVDRLARLLGTLHASMHGARGTGLPDQRTVLHAAIERGSAWLSAEAITAAHARLDGLPSGTALCHGDLHPANVLLGERAVVIDWDNASCGSPAADVARSVFLIRDASMLNSVRGAERLLVEAVRGRFRRVYLATYERLRPLDRGELRAWRLPILAGRLAEGIEPEREALRREIELEVHAAAGLQA